MDVFPPSSRPLLVQWMVDTRPLWPEATQTRQLTTVASRALAALLSDEERAGVLKYFHVRDAKMALVSQLLKHLVVARCTGSDGPVPWRKAVLSRDGHGKPVFYHEKGRTQLVVFNVSHQNGLVVLAAVYGGQLGGSGDSSAFEVGIDVVSPQERRLRDHQMMAEEARQSGMNSVASGWLHFVDVHADVLSPSEVRYLKSVAADMQMQDDERLRLFYGLWCLREAYVKMTGEALLAKWLADLEFREFRVPGIANTPLESSAAMAEADSLCQGEMETQYDIHFRGASVGDAVNMCLRSVGTGYMVCTAIRAAPGHEADTETRACALALPTTDAIELLQVDDILDFAERSGGSAES
ncbi:hypothetical protein SEPCBS119000_004761 [Sporothrix epigloea]|uniref:holo-[acyl-carrier-protein] synthase n=1 Tax=Sporothrix epigloea TaxID=1892477 RepID=A0ABP0DV34_9PEZI